MTKKRRRQRTVLYLDRVHLLSSVPVRKTDRGGGVVMKELDFDILEQSFDYQRDVNYTANGGSSETICSGTSEMQKKLFDTLYRWRIRK